MSTEQTLSKIAKLEGDGFIQNLIAQANARYILYNTSENPENFPPYTIQDDQLTVLAMQYLNLGCALAEENKFEEARQPLEKGASILEYIYTSDANKSNLKTYYGIISSLAYYVAFQYSKAFVLTNTLRGEKTEIAMLLNLFLRRDYTKIEERIYGIITDPDNSDDSIAKNEDDNASILRIYEVTIGKALIMLIGYFRTGDNKILSTAKQLLNDLKEIAVLQEDPGIWWVIRLLLLISEGFQEAALWNALGHFFDLNNDVVKKYIYGQVYQSSSITELFITQRNALIKVLDPKTDGCIISIPTSSGKTKIAEIAILNNHLKNPESKVLYLAPFKSLAFEIENTLEKGLNHSGIFVSQLYGGNSYSQFDAAIIEESSVIIVTPEKAKAILRSNPEIIKQVKLVIIDEGHLLGMDTRLIANEIFCDELRFSVKENGGKFLVLSAVLPNPEDLAEWLTESKENVYRSSWRPSEERLGIMEWTGKNINLRWESTDTERECFNNNFIVSDAIPLTGRNKIQRYTIGDKNAAVAACAIKFKVFGKVLIFVGLKASVQTMAKAYLAQLGTSPSNFNFKNKLNWQAYEMACVEAFGDENDWLRFARKGILCHSADLPTDVRLPLERIMRTENVPVIIATSTLGQGVNLGVSTVIFSTLFQAGEAIKYRDFWNIAGRAGRAFVDHEGKILIALNIENSETDPLKRSQKIRKIRSERRDARKYFDKDEINKAQSGMLEAVTWLKNIAKENNVKFDLLIELLADNKLSDLTGGEKADEFLDYIDDTLLSLECLMTTEEGGPDVNWVEAFFKKSLCHIQALKQSEQLGKEVLEVVKGRVKGIIKKVGESRQRWQSIVMAGLPLNSNLFIENILPSLTDLIRAYNITEQKIEDKIAMLASIEKLLEEIPVLSENKASLESQNRDVIRTKWLNAEAVSEIFTFDCATDIINDIYNFKLPWLLNGIAKKLRLSELNDEAESVEELSILVESGLPNIIAVKIYQAGIRSRTAANELSEFFFFDDKNRSTKSYKTDLVQGKDGYKELVSQKTGEWLELLASNANRAVRVVQRIPDFNFPDDSMTKLTLSAKIINDKQYLVSPDLTFMEDVSESDINFKEASTLPGVYFVYSESRACWVMKVDNPYISVARELPF